jgi:hypothetical protein
VASVQFSRTVERRMTPADAGFMRARSVRVCPTTGGRRSLKTQQHDWHRCGPTETRSPSSRESLPCASIQPGSVDMLGPNAQSPTGSQGSRRSRGPDGRHTRGTVVLPRKEVIQPQLPLRLPCSRRSPCRHGAWTISSSSLLETKPRIEQTSLPRMPRTNAHRKGLMTGCQNIEPPEIWIYLAARVMNPTAIYAFRHEHCS